MRRHRWPRSPQPRACQSHRSALLVSNLLGPGNAKIILHALQDMQARQKEQLYLRVPGIRIDGLDYAAYMDTKRQRNYPLHYAKLPAIRINALTKREYNKKLQANLARVADNAVRRYLANPILRQAGATGVTAPLRQRFPTTLTRKLSTAPKTRKATKVLPVRRYYHTRSKNSRTRKGTRYNRAR